MSAAWWRRAPVLRRFVVDLLADEMARHRRAAVQHASLWSDHLRLDDDLGCDSLELVTLATALAEAVHLHESGIEDYLLARRTLGDWISVVHTGLERFDARLTFRTSGSSGVPKACVHALQTLHQEVAHLATLFPGRQRVLCAVPAHHIYGFLFSVLLPEALGLGSEDAVLDLRAGTPAWLARGARAGDLVVGFPDFWASVARVVPRMPEGVMGVTSCAPCPPEVARTVEAAGLERLVHVYGASETAGIAARADWRSPYTLFPYWRLVDDHRIARQMPEGREHVHLLQDRLVPCGERQVQVGPRHDQAVQVGGNNVFPARVREILKRHPAVEDAAVRLMRPEEGARLKAFVVPRPGWTAAGTDAQAALRAWIDQELAPAERPRAIRFGAYLPATPAGKPADWSLDD